MTKEELKEHCQRQVQQFERVEKIMPVTPNDWKRYEEHKLILELLEQERSVIAELEKIKEEIQGLIDFEESCCCNATLGYECLGVINESIEAIRGKSIEKENKNDT